ncbi:YgjP-like metallopeptidase domain-containing protein, partial [Bacillus safensis]|uniref:YgjP-like metallopeptidase domain-containing protein n=1 Tax=Bacillus safensis TaxID=561879 RepID=UPI002DD44118
TPGTVPYLGAELRLVPERGRARVHRSGDTLLVPADGVAEAGHRPAEPAIERWYRRAARAEIGPRLDAAVVRAGTSYTKLTIRSQRTR